MSLNFAAVQIIVVNCAMCGRRLGIFKGKATIKYASGTRTVCNDDYQRLLEMDLPEFTQTTCSSANCARFVLIYSVLLLVFSGCMAAIGVTQCGSTDSDRDTGCFVGLFIFGFFGSALCVLTFPIVFWSVLASQVRQRRDEAAFRAWEQGRRGVVLGGEQHVSSSPLRAEADARLRAAAKTRALEHSDAVVEPAPFVPPSAPNAESDSDRGATTTM